ncbi:hypothetical protein RhiirA4_142935 [Rhizophagus irregularis]|uniref:Uncharacterized protein n=1 Tax=Rhizophagus irregularis TaxID=588596 RepID=A0A2I1GCE9_9GLOM|nr:hypothetical protein RhiirA4_142935 [Rhizophagus irregularis]
MMIKLVTCSASDISRLNNTQIQNIIGYVNAKTVTNGNDQSHVTSAESVTVENGNQLPYDPESVKLLPQDEVEYCLSRNSSSMALLCKKVLVFT